MATTVPKDGSFPSTIFFSFCSKEDGTGKLYRSPANFPNTGPARIMAGIPMMMPRMIT